MTRSREPQLRKLAGLESERLRQLRNVQLSSAAPGDKMLHRTTMASPATIRAALLPSG